ncbi:hypothetical protein RHMOL_Rhmol02G0005700 [Rhododendron molle]|uniref:Uncharacterized protein n=1 Tax=Rhododendron molle TaxID=49168 RepID=A0ACC0PMQ6_RHOML|nr:hypothetical protein RHMOL_Rhmol02G0005700 [Rhododendron molle]
MDDGLVGVTCDKTMVAMFDMHKDNNSTVIDIYIHNPMMEHNKPSGEEVSTLTKVGPSVQTDELADLLDFDDIIDLDDIVNLDEGIMPTGPLEGDDDSDKDWEIGDDTDDESDADSHDGTGDDTDDFSGFADSSEDEEEEEEVEQGIAIMTMNEEGECSDKSDDDLGSGKPKGSGSGTVGRGRGRGTGRGRGRGTGRGRGGGIESGSASGASISVATGKRKAVDQPQQNQASKRLTKVGERWFPSQQSNTSPSKFTQGGTMTRNGRVVTTISSQASCGPRK